MVLEPTDSLLKAAQAMVHENTHRVAVASPGEDVVGVVTQTTILNALREHVGDLGSFGHVVVGSLFPAASPPFTLPASSTLRHCLQQLLLNGYEGCALVDDTSDGVTSGAAVGNISRSDIRRLSASLAAGLDVEAVLNGPVLWYLQDPTLSASTPSTTSLKVITVTPRDSMAALINLLCVTHIHRVHVVDTHRRPVGVVTAMDIIRALLSPELVSGWGRFALACSLKPLCCRSRTVAPPAPRQVCPGGVRHLQSAVTHVECPFPVPHWRPSGASTASDDSDGGSPHHAHPTPCPLVASLVGRVSALDFLKTSGVLVAVCVPCPALFLPRP